MGGSAQLTKAQYLWQMLHAQLAGSDPGRFGHVVNEFQRQHNLDADTIAEVFLILDNPNQLGWQNNALIRERLRVLLDTKLAAEQVKVQRELAASNDRLGQKMYWLAWAGVAVASVGVLVAVAQLVKG